MAETAPAAISYGGYAALERESEGRKHEWVDGAPVAMSGGSLAHAQLSASVITLLTTAHRGGPCRTASGDMRIFVPGSGNSYYPDASVVCGPPELHPEDPHALLNPTVLVEVLSPRTETFDRGRKGTEYRTLESLTDLLFVAQDRRHVEHWRRAEVGWHVREVTDGALELTSGAVLPIDTLYDGVA